MLGRSAVGECDTALALALTLSRIHASEATVGAWRIGSSRKAVVVLCDSWVHCNRADSCHELPGAESERLLVERKGGSDRQMPTMSVVVLWPGLRAGNR